MAREIEDVIVENTRMLFRNFSGKEDRFNRAGDVNFCVILPNELAEQMLEDGWNVKVLEAREDEEGEEDAYFIKVAVGYKARPPRIVMVTESGGRTPLGEDGIEVLDWVDVKSVDVILRPYHWNAQGDSGIKAYVKSLFVVIDEDPLERKWGTYDNADD